MGIYDREYIRGESSGTGLFGGVTPVTKSIVVISAVVFLLENLLNWRSQGISAAWLWASPEYTFHHFRLFQLLTAPFVNWDPFQLVFDMYFLWIIGREMESLYGSRDFLAFCVASALIATLAGLAVATSAGLNVPIFGPWGVVMAVLTLYALYYPRKEFLFMFFIPMPAWGLAAIYLLRPMLSRLGGTSSGIDTGMVLAGAAFAYGYKQLDLRWSRLVAGRRFRPRLRIFSGPSGYEAARPRGWSPPRPSSGGGGRAPAVSVLPEEQLDARVDEILAKIARDGNRDGLTDEEQRILQEASRRARIRRSDRI